MAFWPLIILASERSLADLTLLSYIPFGGNMPLESYFGLTPFLFSYSLLISLFCIFGATVGGSS